MPPFQVGCVRDAKAWKTVDFGLTIRYRRGKAILQRSGPPQVGW